MNNCYLPVSAGVAKPWDDALLFSIEKELQRAGHRRSNSSASSSVQTGPFPELLGHHQSMQTLFQRIQQLSTAHVPIFIYGETGAGKELVARAAQWKPPAQSAFYFDELRQLVRDAHGEPIIWVQKGRLYRRRSRP